MRRIDLSKLNPRQRAFVIGFKRGLSQSRKTYRAELHELLKEVAAMKADYAALAVRHHRAMLARAVDEAEAERSAHPGQLLH